MVGIREHKDCTPEQRKVRECNAGIYSVDADFLWKALANIRSANAQGEFYLTDLVEMAAAQGPVGSIDAEFGETAGVNDRVELYGGDEYVVRRLTGSASRRAYTCPGCHQPIRPATPRATTVR